MESHEAFVVHAHLAFAAYPLGTFVAHTTLSLSSSCGNVVLFSIKMDIVTDLGGDRTSRAGWRRDLQRYTRL